MLRILGENNPLCDSLNRRELLRVGGTALGGLTLAGLLQSRAQAAPTPAKQPKAKSVIVLFNSGGIPHHETWDPKPDAPEEVRGAFGVIRSRTPGLLVGELMPKTAKLTDKIAVIRTMVTGDNAHSTSGYQMLTGVPHIPMGKENSTPGKPNDVAPYNAIINTLRPSQGGLPAAITLPRRLANFGGLYPWPGTNAGVLGSKSEPWLLECDPSADDFTPPGCALPDDVSPERLNGRRALLDQIDRGLEASYGVVGDLDRYKQRAWDMVAGGAARAAFAIDKESEKVRDRYGRTKYGQCVLLARRLVEAGVSLVQVNWASQDKNRPNSGGWDTHIKHNESLKGWLMPSMDQTYSALIEDLAERGLLDETLVCWVAEFGHTPKFNKREGRDHWGRVFSIALAGGGVQGGIVFGNSDKHAAEPIDSPTRPADYLATIYHCLGYTPDTIVHDIEGRPLPISHGRVIEEILT